ncbi:protein PEP-RELATED DEVELOPMENT ARRESTED 1 homolog, chloroplastic [Wolffia australiana]
MESSSLLLSYQQPLLRSSSFKWGRINGVNILPSCSSSSSLNCRCAVFSPIRSNFLAKKMVTDKLPSSSPAFSSSFACRVGSIGGGFTGEGGFGLPDDEEIEKWDSAKYEALLKGGDQVTSVLEEMAKLLEGTEMDESSEAIAIEIAAQGVIGKRVDEMEAGFMMALDYMIKLAERDQDDQRKSLLEVIKRTVLDHLTQKCPPHVQVIGLLCRTPEKDSRHELLRRVAAGGGVFKNENGAKIHLPGANLNDIANQADDLLETMESRTSIPDRKLLARLVLIREEARSMMGGGILDERNDRGLKTLPEAEVNFLAKLISLKPGEAVQKMIKNVMLGKDEGAEDLGNDNEDSKIRRAASGGIAGRGSVTGRQPRPVRPGMFLETVSKVLGGVYSGNVSGMTAQHLEWVHEKTLLILQEMAFQ